VKPILVVDCYVDGDGSLNFRRLLGDYPVTVWRPSDGMSTPELASHRAIMISGSAACVTDPVPWMDSLSSVIHQARDQKVPVLGICFGHQIVAHALFGHGSVRKAETPEIGWKSIEITGADPLLEGLGAEFKTFASHFDEVRDGIPGMTVLARSADCEVQAYRVDGNRIWGVQFHAEMKRSEAEELAVTRIEGRPDLGLDLNQTLAQSMDSTPLASVLFENFLALT